MDQNESRLIMDSQGVERTIARMAHELVELNNGTDDLVLLGIHRRGIYVSDRLAHEIEESVGYEIPTGTLDITLYRDDLMAIGPRPIVGETRLPRGGVDGRAVALVDDVIYTGRTVRAALDEITDFGRPSRIYLCALIDRGGRELPIHPDIVGKTVEVPPGQTVDLHVPDFDGELAVRLVSVPGA